MLALGKLSRTQVDLLYVAPERNEHGSPVMADRTIGRVMSPRELFAYRCFLNHVRDPLEVSRLWAEEQTKRHPHTGS